MPYLIVASDVAADVGDRERAGDADAGVGGYDSLIGPLASDVAHFHAQATNFIGSQQTVAPLSYFPSGAGKEGT